MSENIPWYRRLTSWTSQPTIKEAVLDAEADKGLFARFATSKVKKYQVESLEDYYNAYLNDDLVRAMVDDLVESALGNGYHTIAKKVSKKKKLNKTKTLVDEYGKHFRLDAYMPNIVRNTLIAGFCPVETVIQKSSGKDSDFKDFSKCKLKIIRPDTIDRQKGIYADTSTFPPKILKVHQKVGQKKEIITAGGDKSIAWYVYGQLGNDIRGVSFVRGILTLLNTLNDATADVQKILKRYVAPIGVWKGEQATTLLKQAVVNRDAGEDIFLGNLTPEEMASGVVEFHTIDPRVPFWDYLEYLDRRVWNYSRAANMYYMRNATQASAEILDGIIRRHVTAIQRFARRGMENYWFRPLCDKFLGEPDKYDDIVLRFGVEKTQVEDIQLEGFLAAGIRYNYVPRKVYYKILEQLGVEIELSKEEMEELEKEPLGQRAPPGKSNQQPPKAQVSPGSDTAEKPKEPHYTENRMFYLKQCMDCGSAVKQSVVWEKGADGLVYYAWFCDECLSDWIVKRENRGDKIISIKPVLGGKVSEDFASYYSGYEHVEALPNLRPGLGIPLMRLDAQIKDGNKIVGVLTDLKHMYPNRNPIYKKSKFEDEEE
jgi:hypothetical protein